MKRQKKYTTREQIIKDIDASIRKRDKLMSKAQAADEAAEFFRVSENDSEYRKFKEESDSMLAKAGRITNTRLKRLGRTLAMFDTEPLSACGLDDKQVTLQSS